MSEIKRFFPRGLPVFHGENPILAFEGIKCPGLDTNIAVNQRVIWHQPKGKKLYDKDF